VPARDLLSTSPGARYDFYSGSSMGAARVAGLTALLRQEDAHASAADVLRNLDRRLAALGDTKPDTRVVTHNAAPGIAPAPPARGQPANAALGVEGS
jgi:hypothetical protein